MTGHNSSRRTTITSRRPSSLSSTSPSGYSDLPALLSLRSALESEGRKLLLALEEVGDLLGLDKDAQRTLREASQKLREVEDRNEETDNESEARHN